MIKNNLNKKIKLGMFLLIGILLTASVFAYTISNPQYVSPISSSSFLSGQGVSLTQSFSGEACKAGQDFVVQISPLGCTPTVVRSDLLEEQNVPVFCQLVATKINPLIDVEAIESISFNGDYSKEVSGVGFHPANAGIKTSQSTLLNSPVLNNIGYAVIVLKKQPNETAMPDWVQGNMTAKIRYDVKNAFGIGSGTYYLPEMDKEEWNLNYKSYGFWQGKGFLKADYLDSNGAVISIYKDKENKITSVSLEKGKTSGKINVPGFYCLASLQLRLDDLQVPDTRAKLNVDGTIAESAKGEKFLDNKCSVRSIDKKGLNQKVNVYCSTDEGGKNFDFKISPRVRLNDGTERDLEVGQRVFDNVYVGYITSKDTAGGKIIDSTEAKNLIVYFYNSSSDLGNNLNEGKIYSIGNLVESKIRSGKKVVFDINSEVKGVQNNGDVFGKKIDIVGFAGAQDGKLDDAVKENYENAIKDFDMIIDSYAGVEKSSDEKLGIITYGEEAFYEKINLADKSGQKASAKKFCEKFKEMYPASGYLNKLGDICEDEYLGSSSESASWSILVNGVVKEINFKGIYEPGWEEYSAEIVVGDEPVILMKNEIKEVDANTNVQLISLEDSSDERVAKIKVNYKDENKKDVSKTFTLKERAIETFGDNTIVLSKINLKKQAKISVIPSIDNVGTEADFTFKIGIEKRAIQLSPEKTREKIKNLDKTIEKWEGVSGDLGSVVKGMKGACLTTSAFLTVKNFFEGFSGKAAARQDVTEMYRNKCKTEKATNMQECLLKYNNAINKDVDKLAEINTNRMKISDEIVNAYNATGYMENSEKFLNGIEEKPSKELLKENNYQQELKDILYYQEMKDRGGIFEKEANEKLKKIWIKLDEDYADQQLQKTSVKDWENNGLKMMTIQSAVFKDQRPISYTGATSDGKFGIGTAEKPVPVQGLMHNSEVYILELSSAGGGIYGIKEVYFKDGKKVGDNLKKEIQKSYSIKEFDEKSYDNKYDTPEVIYYEIGEYKGRPAIVPVDVNKGFYAATTTDSGSLSAYDASAMPSYFYLCNVMSNGKQEFNLGGDDECVGVRVGSNKADGALTGLSESETNNWARKAISALREASKQYKAGVTKISVGGQKIPVGNPAPNLLGTQCEDFMSPADCALMFNVCDPVICPESRCDFGGAYRVSNVIQSGIVGSTLLCLPNFGNPSEGGVVIPVCLTGIKAGIDSLLSVYQNYRDCLQENLETGKTLAICDEIHSIYLCEFFWKQAIPISKLAFSKLTGFFFGSRGGGEYLQIGEAWDNSANSITYMTNYYGADSFAAFKTRSTDEVGSEVCKNFISARYPASGNFFDALIEPDSPSQYHAWFSESTFTTATVPPTSQYKVFYHIYAGKDSGIFYSVYMKSPIGSSFYSDAPQVTVASGYITKGGYASETKDFLEVSGYKELCVNVQGQEECGFKEVSTSFALDYIQDQYIKEQAGKTNIKSEKECVSGSASVYNMATPNVQAGVESALDPQIYNQGVVRVCATSNPGDVDRWIEVGTCGGDLKCYLDKDSVGEAVVFNESLKGLKKTTEDALDKLKREEGYMSDAEFAEFVKKVENTKDKSEKIKLITDVLEKKGDKKIFLNREKVQLLFLRAKAYVGLVVDFIDGKKGVVAEKPVSSGTATATVSDTAGTTTEKIDCDNLMNWEEKIEINGFKYRIVGSKLKIFRTNINKGKCDGQDIEKIFKETETNYYIEQSGDGYVIKKSVTLWFDSNVGAIGKEGLIRIDVGEEISDLGNYVLKDGKFALK